VPKIVDHDERRLELVDATWRIIARLGIEGATMREIALEAGFANGALKPYFPTKDTLLTFAFGHVFNRTNERIREVTAGKAGIPALKAFCVEVLPLDSERVNEARIVVPFWQKAINDPGKAAIHRESMEQWHASILGYLGQGARNSPRRGGRLRRRRPPAEHAARRADCRSPRPRGPGRSTPGRSAGRLPDPARNR
jgi:AcrR family transcriptional regulator